MPIKFNSNNMSIKLGQSNISKVYKGSNLVYSSSSQQTALLCHFNTDFSDSSENGYSFGPIGDASISSSQSKFGGSSLYLDGYEDSLSLPIYDSNLNLTGEVPYTVEFWMYMESYNYYYTTILTRRTGGNWQYLIGFSDPYSLRLYFSGNSQSNFGYSQIDSGSYEIPLQQWVHVAAVVNNGEAKLFVDGDLKGSGPWEIQQDNSASLYVGQEGSSSEFFHGYIDELRIIKGAAVYSNNFSPPTSEFLS